MKVLTLGINGAKESEIELPLVFSTPFRKDLISKSFTNLNSHKFQPQGRKPTAGMDVVARSNDPPTGQGRSRIAKMPMDDVSRLGVSNWIRSMLYFEHRKINALIPKNSELRTKGDSSTEAMIKGKKYKADAVDGQHYYTKDGKLKLVKDKKVLTWDPKSKKFK